MHQARGMSGGRGGGLGPTWEQWQADVLRRDVCEGASRCSRYVPQFLVQAVPPGLRYTFGQAVAGLSQDPLLLRMPQTEGPVHQGHHRPQFEGTDMASPSEA